MFNRKAKPATQSDLDFMATVKSYGCVLCDLNRARGEPVTHQLVEFNHHLHAGKRIGRTTGTGECLWHHRGEPRDGWTKAAMLRAYGPARNYQGEKGGFREAYGTDEELRNHLEAMR